MISLSPLISTDHPQDSTLVLASICITGCSDSTAPSVSPAIVLTLDTFVESSGGETNVRVESKVKNTGSVAVHYPIRCGYSGEISLRDEAGAWLVLRDPTLIIVCPPGFNSLGTGESIEGGISLIWAWNEYGEKYKIPPGHYTAKTSFTFYIGGNDEPRFLEQELPLDID